jgi:hypothetical protein
MMLALLPIACCVILWLAGVASGHAQMEQGEASAALDYLFQRRRTATIAAATAV